MSLRNSKSMNRSSPDDDFYSALAAEAGDDQDSDVSDADVAALTKALSDMDDMDDALFASSLKNRKSSTLKSEKSGEGAKNSGNDRELAGTRTLSPPSLINTADSKRRTFTIKEEESSPDIASKASEKSQPAGKKPMTKSFNFGEFDEDDPLAGLLSDDDEQPAPKKKSSQRTARTQPKEDVNKQAEDFDLDSPKKSSPSFKRSTSLSRGEAGEKEIEAEQSITRAKSAPPPKRSETPKRNDDVDFGDDDILDTMGFDDSPPQAKKPSEKKEDEEIQAAKSKVADLFGKKSAVSPPDKPPVGRTKEFVLDVKYRKQERGKPQKELDEEDFSFGSYTPSAVNTLKRPDSAPPGRRSVRFADDVDDLFGGTSTLGRPTGGAGRQRSNSQVVGGSSDRDKSTGRTRTDVKGQGDDDGDWLSLAIGKSNERKVAEQKETLNVTGNKEENIGQEEEKEDKKKSVVTDQPKGILRGESKEDSVEESKGPKEAENPRAASASDYLGLGDDIDLDKLLSSSKPASRLGNSRRRDTRSSFPWDDDDDVNEMNTTADLGSTMDSKLLGETMSTEEEGDSRSSSLIAKQIAELDKLEELDQAKKMTRDNDPSVLDGESAQLNYLHQTPAPSQETKIQGSRQSSGMPQAQPQVANTFTESSPPVDVADQEEGRKLSEDPGGIGEATAGPPKRSQSATPGVKREPQWRQELKKRQELMQTQTSEQHSPAQEPSQPATIGSTPPLAATIPRDSPVFQAPPAPSLPIRSDFKEPSVNHWQDQLIQQQAESFEKAMREQQDRLKAQQEEQMMQMQKIQQERMQQQLQMQQQMLQAQTVTPQLPQMMSFPGHPFQNSFRPPGYESKVHQLEEEKRFLEMSLQSLQDQHKQQLSAKETAHQDYIHLLEDSFKKKEERLIQEQEEQKRRFEERLREMALERGKMMTEHYERIQEIQADHLQQRNIINQGHTQELESMREKHQKDLDQVRTSMQEELKAMNEVTGHSRSLQAVVDQVGVVGQELGSLQTKISGEHQQRLERQQTELQQKDQQLQVLQKNLEHQQEEMVAERSRLESMIQRLETQIRQQSTQLDEERWRLRQEQSKLSSFQKALEEERRIAAEQTAAQQVSLQQARESLTAEQQSNMAQCMEERKALAADRAQIVRERKELEATIKQQMEKIARENADREGRLRALMEDEKKISSELENTERQREEQKREKQKLEKERVEMNREQEKLQEMAERLHLRAQQIEEAVEDAVQVRQEGVTALENAQKIESEQTQREQGILEQLQALRATERQIAQERLKQAEEESRAERLMSEGLCPNCARSVIGVKGSREAVLLPITAGPGSDRYMVPPQQTYPSPLMSRKEELVDHLLSKAEFDHTVSVWRIAANKDKDFLEEETSFLNSLRIQSQP